MVTFIIGVVIGVVVGTICGIQIKAYLVAQRDKLEAAAKNDLNNLSKKI